MDKPKNWNQSGTFTLPPGREILGQLSLEGPKTELFLRDDQFFNTHDLPDRHIFGQLHDLTKVSLHGCITTEGLGSATRGNNRYHYAKVFPHFVIYGDRHIAPTDRSIAEIHFVMDDASTLFYDFDAFGSLSDARPYIKQIVEVNEKAYDRTIPLGSEPEILYFTGRRVIFEVDTNIGKVSARHNVGQSWGGPSGIALQSTIIVTIAFPEPTIFSDSIRQLLILLRYLELLVGRPQNVTYVSLRIASEDPDHNDLRVYWCMPPTRDASRESRNPHPGEILVDAVHRPEEFARVMTNWLARQDQWGDARMRFSSSLAWQNLYDIDRLVGAANMFDILPSTAFPSDVPLSPKLKAATDDARRIFKELPPSPERDGVLGALGRVQTRNLKQKIRFRAQSIIDALGEPFSGLISITDEAVNCRNHYVHGGAASFDYQTNPAAVNFLTNTLEFVFAASDLIKSGWDISHWLKQGTVQAHPFGAYTANFADSCNRLKKLIAST